MQSSNSFMLSFAKFSPSYGFQLAYQEIPHCLISMYGMFTYIWLIFMVNVGKYTIHGSFGIDSTYFLKYKILEFSQLVHGFLHPQYTFWKFNHSTLGPSLPGPKEKDHLPSIIYSGANCLTSRVYMQLSVNYCLWDPKNPWKFMKIVSPKDMSEMIRENEGNMGSHDVFYIIPLGH